jgi:hypothetical protein
VRVPGTWGPTKARKGRLAKVHTARGRLWRAAGHPPNQHGRTDWNFFSSTIEYDADKREVPKVSSRGKSAMERRGKF